MICDSYSSLLKNKTRTRQYFIDPCIPMGHVDPCFLIKCKTNKLKGSVTVKLLQPKEPFQNTFVINVYVFISPLFEHDAGCNFLRHVSTYMYLVYMYVCRLCFYHLFVTVDTISNVTMYMNSLVQCYGNFDNFSVSS